MHARMHTACIYIYSYTYHARMHTAVFMHRKLRSRHPSRLDHLAHICAPTPPTTQVSSCWLQAVPAARRKKQMCTPGCKPRVLEFMATINSWSTPANPIYTYAVGVCSEAINLRRDHTHNASAQAHTLQLLAELALVQVLARRGDPRLHGNLLSGSNNEYIYLQIHIRHTCVGSLKPYKLFKQQANTTADTQMKYMRILNTLPSRAGEGASLEKSSSASP